MRLSKILSDNTIGKSTAVIEILCFSRSLYTRTTQSFIGHAIKFNHQSDLRITPTDATNNSRYLLRHMQKSGEDSVTRKLGRIDASTASISINIAHSTHTHRAHIRTEHTYAQSNIICSRITIMHNNYTHGSGHLIYQYAQQSSVKINSSEQFLSTTSKWYYYSCRNTDLELVTFNSRI